MFTKSSLAIIIASMFATSIVALSPTDRPRQLGVPSATIHDYATYINSNNLLGFVSNSGEIFGDMDMFFGKTDGLYFPYSTNDAILDGSNSRTVVYSAGLWMGGKVNGGTRIAIAEYSTEYAPGPMIGVNRAPDAFTNPDYRVFKLYSDSLASNPNSDYLAWPTAQGAPVDRNGHPLALGDQTLFSVFNDVGYHTNNAGSTLPLGIEVRHTTWGHSSSGNDTVLIPASYVGVPTRLTSAKVTAQIMNPNVITGHEYLVEIRTDQTLGNVWKLVDQTAGVTLLDDQTNFTGNDNYPIVDGMRVRVTGTGVGFGSFTIVANGGGQIDSALSAAFGSVGFPTPGGGDPASNMQVTGQRWAIHTADNGGTEDGGTRGSYASFVSRVTRDNMHWPDIGMQDFEMRFTGSPDNPGVNGSYAYEAYGDGNVFWVPFELWNIGQGTPEDPSDDYQLVTWILDDGGISFQGDDKFALESWGGLTNGGGNLEHSVSEGIDDPYTDWVYWTRPLDTTPGTSGYDAAEALMLAGSYSGENEREILARIVLVAWDAGVAPPFYAPDNSPLQCPEQGSVFRIETMKGFLVPDTFTFTATPPQIIASGSEGNCVYMQYDLFNKGENHIYDLYLSLWVDPDLGSASDDLVGCDTIAGVFYDYNGNNNDLAYGARPPAVGLRLVQGPAVVSAGDSAVSFGRLQPDHRNLPVSAFVKYINGTDPSSPLETYDYMQGMEKTGMGMQPYRYPPGTGPVTRFHKSGDPVTGVGDVDANPSDRRMMASIGPLNMVPGDSQQVIVKWGVGQGTDRLNSITRLKQNLASAVNLQTNVQQLSFNTDSTELPASQVLVLSNYFAGALTWHAQKSKSWLTINRTFGISNPDTITVAPNTVLSPGTYHDTIVVLGLDNASGPVLIPVTYSIAGPPCCIGTTGNLSSSGTIDLSDLSYLIAWLTMSPTPVLPCPEAADVNISGNIDLTDLSLLISYLTNGSSIILPQCPSLSATSPLSVMK